MTTAYAPIVQVMLTLQFAPPLSNLDPVTVADVFNAFRAEFPVFEQVARAGPMPVDPDVLEIPNPLGSPRNSFLTDDRSKAIMFQDDRFSFLWQRKPGSDLEYPGYDAIVSEALAHWRKIEKIAVVRSAHALMPLVGEITYTDQFLLSQQSPAQQMAAIFAPLDRQFSTDARRVQVSYSEAAGPDGFYEVQIVGPVPIPEPIGESKLCAQMQTIGRFPIRDSWDGVSAGFNRMHDHVKSAFTHVVRSEFRPI